MPDWFDGNGDGHQADVASMLDGLAAQGIRELVECGALVSIGLTRDGGALAVTVTVDGRWRRDYFRNVDELLAWLAEAVPFVADLRGVERPSAAPRGRQRRSSGS